MDPTRFDTLARSAATPATRRAALGALAAGGLLRALGLGRAAPQASAAQNQGQNQGGQGSQGGLCVVAFVATVRQGPSAGAALVAGGAPGELRGNLRFSLSDSGALQNADLLLADGSSLPVVGQATGHALKVRINFGQGRALVVVGVGAQPVTQCLGPFDGPATGPEVGDLGEWHAAAGVQNLPGAAADGANQGGANQGGGNRQRGAGQSGNANQRGNRPAGAATASSAGGAPITGTLGIGNRETAPPQPDGSCPDGLTRCGDECVNTTTDPINCGGCGLACATGLVCVGGNCIPGGIVGPGETGGTGGADCPQGETRCGAACVVTSRDPRNCGGCGNACVPGEDCVGGACGCVGGRTVCNGACVNTTNDPANCGGCGTACATGEVCVGSDCIPGGIVGTGGGTGGAAQADCPENQDFCGPAGCIDLFADNAQHCGGCGVVCPSGTCDGGTCAAGPGGACPPNQTDCGDGVCIDLQTDPFDCGACGTVCQPSEECVGGKCALVDCGVDAAGAPLTNCGVCDNLQTSAINCGTCGTVCATGQVCANGTCTAGTAGGGGCPAGQLLCGTECRDGLPNFGSDGLSCPGGGAPPTGCPAGRELCNGACFPAGACPAAADCPAGQGYCYGLCRDFRTDPGYCGNCETACPGQVCAGGQCVSCLEGRTPCGTRCVDTKTDLDNCGFCGNRCGTQCLDGTCTGVGPSPIDCAQTGESCLGRPCCDGGRCACRGRETPCDVAICYAPRLGGQNQCEQGLTTCYDFCVDVRTDPIFCGDCGLDSYCNDGEECRDGRCEAISSASSNTLTSRQAIAPEEPSDEVAEPSDESEEASDEEADPEPAPDEPVLGDVVLDCAAQGLTDCGGVCVDLASDSFNCGECGVGCGADPCVERVCTPAPPAAEAAPIEEAPLVAEAAAPVEEAPPESVVEDAVAACLAAGEACDPANPGACCSGGCGADGFCT